jgi:hypothetical protein
LTISNKGPRADRELITAADRLGVVHRSEVVYDHADQGAALHE